MCDLVRFGIDHHTVNVPRLFAIPRCHAHTLIELHLNAPFLTLEAAILTLTICRFVQRSVPTHYRNLRHPLRLSITRLPLVKVSKMRVAADQRSS